MPIQGVIDVVQAVRGAGIVPQTYYREHCPYEQLKDEKDHRIQVIKFDHELGISFFYDWNIVRQVFFDFNIHSDLS